MSGQVILVRFFHENCIQGPPGRPLLHLHHGTIFLRSCSIFTVLKRSFSREQNTRRNDDEENSGSGKLKVFFGISGYGRIFHEKSGSNNPPGGPLESSRNLRWSQIMCLMLSKKSRVLLIYKR